MRWRDNGGDVLGGVWYEGCFEIWFYDGLIMFDVNVMGLNRVLCG